VRALAIAAGGGIGDVLLATPAMRALRTRYDEVVGLTAPAHAEVLAHDPDLAEVWTDDEPFDRLAARVAAGRFDAAIVTWANLRTAALPFVARIPERVGQANRLYSMLFTKAVHVRSESGDRTTHWTQVLLDYARALDCDTPDATPIFQLTSDDRIAGEVLLRDADVRSGYLVIHPTRGISSRRPKWPVERLAALTRELSLRFGYPVVVSGGPGDSSVAEFIAAASGGTSIAGNATLGAFAAIAEQARAVIALDSGPMHLAAAVGAPTVGIFAMQPDEPDRWAPLGRNTAIVRPAYPCPPRHRKETCPDFACVAALTASEISAAVEKVMARSAAGGGGGER
jgi:ADP-heptose:LPS heptosyltransferase